MSRLIAPLGALMLLCACQDADRTSPAESRQSTSAPAPGVVATYSGGRITAGDVDAYILTMPAGERPSSGADLDAWYGELIRALVVDRILLREAREAELDQTGDFRLHRTTIERQLAVQSCLAELKPGLGEISDQELEDAYTEREEAFRAPERRSTYHIYLRLEPGNRIEALEAEMRSLRDRILRGENFQRLARTESDSETRHRQGSIGWVVRGQLPEAFEERIFSLAEGVPSQPLVTRDGVHLFQVDDILAERQLSMKEIGRNLRSRLEAEKLAQALDEVAAMNPSPDARMVNREALKRLIDEGLEQEPVLSTDDYTVSLEEFRLRLGRALGPEAGIETGLSGRIQNDLAWRFLNRLHRHEAAYEYCTDEGLVADTAVADRMKAWEERALASRMRQQRLHERVTADVTRLELYYQSNIGQFTPPVQWHLERLRIPFSNADEGKDLMEHLEEISATDTVSLEALQRELGGELETLGWKTLLQMRGINSKLPKRVSPLAAGALVAPLRTGNRLELYRVVERKEFEPRPLDEARDEVAAAYLRQYTSEVYDELEADILDRVRFELHADRLETLRGAGLPESRITVEQLDALLSGS